MAATMANLFAGNPMATPVGHKIEEATDPSLASEDWTLNMEICDIINSSEEAAKDAARAIKKRLHHFSGKNYTAVMYTLTVLETCVKNCGRNFHHLICQKDYIQDLIKLIGPKNEPPLAVQEKVLGLVRSWAVTFRGQPDLNGVAAVYDELLAKGVQFPEGGDSAAAPIITPQRSTPAHAPAPAASPSAGQTHRSQPESQGSQPLDLTAEQADKLKKEIHVVDGNVHVLNEMLSTLKPSTASEDDLQLLKHLAETCRAMQQRLVALVGRVTRDDITAELLRLNDELNNAFIRYERFERGRSGNSGSPDRRPAAASPSSSGPPPAAAAAAVADGGALIDLGDDPETVSRQMEGLAVGGGGSTFQQVSRIPNVTGAEAAGGAAGVTPAQPSRTDGAAADNIGGDEARDGMLTNSEFDRFLAERAAAADSGAGPGAASSQQRNQ
ncbi:TOM1-like protein 2 [Amphibalanus amphitrite]|uniref:TOM1-like protein 2 n=1 Tax=Amphibalanus amphitrite TaxID=1232801 RepID=A0A6A4VZL2_AMPAM|nr:TOM1-like protein 2 isoform X6 [Amphibalanus amphitrite]XP_043201960.1 TOM1-like protein 2 isoform X6 [Amphibalanus amphitrite]XP_043201961.1 TOM1-like protein 2 isoform X6 [Amphibalanus amphitrite]XP_043201962.1 TOM1-like protein 2 isoform X6 [Amphibalanus amphitrite]XP_043201963.1 TOM1-like protein 2 isoform X6 [Amphibalanus amphitrite]XP_043201964.1 TOM1-like protein 2 isoform X6 [Amphibalanus amphitrite]KAF0298690.1 TOM1-like protein 2 [Amphibalanus amphitrite]KAF0300366.1 TOM1-like p